MRKIQLAIRRKRCANFNANRSKHKQDQWVSGGGAKIAQKCANHFSIISLGIIFRQKMEVDQWVGGVRKSLRKVAQEVRKNTPITPAAPGGARLGPRPGARIILLTKCILFSGRARAPRKLAGRDGCPGDRQTRGLDGKPLYGQSEGNGGSF
jgi:hypothetical protein